MGLCSLFTSNFLPYVKHIAIECIIFIVQRWYLISFFGSFITDMFFIFLMED